MDHAELREKIAQMISGCHPEFWPTTVNENDAWSMSYRRRAEQVLALIEEAMAPDATPQNYNRPCEEINGICPWDGTTVHRHVLKWPAQAPGRRTFTCLRGERLILASWVHPREEPLDYVTATPLADGPTVMRENDELRDTVADLRAQLAATVMYATTMRDNVVWLLQFDMMPSDFPNEGDMLAWCEIRDGIRHQAALALPAADVGAADDPYDCPRCLAGEPLRMRWGKYNEYVSHAPDSHTPGMGCRREMSYRVDALRAALEGARPDAGREEGG